MGIEEAGRSNKMFNLAQLACVSGVGEAEVRVVLVHERAAVELPAQARPHREEVAALRHAGHLPTQPCAQKGATA